MNTNRRHLSIVALMLAGGWLVAHAADMLTLDTEKSRIAFTGTKPGRSHSGGFKQFTVDAAADWSDLSKSRIKIDIDAKSLWSDDAMLTGHLRSPDFFDVSRYPRITFETTRKLPRQVDSSEVELAIASNCSR